MEAISCPDVPTPVVCFGLDCSARIVPEQLSEQIDYSSSFGSSCSYFPAVQAGGCLSSLISLRVASFADNSFRRKKLLCCIKAVVFVVDGSDVRNSFSSATRVRMSHCS